MPTVLQSVTCPKRYMRIKQGFELRTVAGETVIVATGMKQVDFSKIIALNPSAAYLWEEVAKREVFSPDELAGLLIRRYEVDLSTAQKDARMIAQKWIEVGIAEE